MLIHEKKVKKLAKIAKEIRIEIIKTLTNAKSGHTAGALGLADIFSCLYFHVLKHNPKKPNWPSRDRLILSCGHVCPVLYTTMSLAGYLKKNELKTLRKLNSRLQGHPSRVDLPGIETSTGPLGQGYSVAMGMALAAQKNNQKHRVYIISSDGEHNEGQIWEAAMFAAKYRLRNVTLIIDRNNIQIDGHTEQVMPIEPLADKYRAFGWHVIEIDGHNYYEIIDACDYAKTIFEKPTVIIAHTIPGKGVDFMENDPLWHGTVPSTDIAKQAIKLLNN